MDELTVGYHCARSQRVLHALLDAGWKGIINIEQSLWWLRSGWGPELIVDVGQPPGPAGALARQQNTHIGEHEILRYAASLRESRGHAQQVSEV